MAKYRFKDEASRKFVWSQADSYMKNNYHNIYTQLGLEKGKNGNFHCFNMPGHEGGRDNNPSLSVNNNRGVWNCKTCGIRGNFQSYWKEYVKKGDESYTDFVIDFLKLNINNAEQMLSDQEQLDYDKNLNKFHDQMNNLIANGEDTSSVSDTMRRLVKVQTHLDMSIADGYTKNLLAMEDKLEYLLETRNIDKDMVEEEKIGWEPSKQGFTFPIITADGYLKNIQIYNPEHPDYKWRSLKEGAGTCPTPYSSLTSKRVYCFEGYPDTYCAKSFGYAAFTMGPAGVTDIEREFGGKAECRRILSGKEVVIVFDDDDESAKFIPVIAGEFYKYASQVKAVSLRKSKSNPSGLDPDQKREINGKLKRTEKDYTNFMRINGFDNHAKYLFDKIVDSTEAWAPDENRTGSGVRKVTLPESKGRSYNTTLKKRVPMEVHASVVFSEQRSYQYPTKICVSCSKMLMEEPKIKGKCCGCSVVQDERFGKSDELNYSFERQKEKSVGVVGVSEKGILGFVDIPDDKRVAHTKKLAGIPPSCFQVEIEEEEIGELLFMHLIPPASEYGITFDADDSHNINIEQEAFLNGFCNIESNKTYKFEGYQVTSPKNGHAVLFFDKVTPIETSIDKFEMTEEAHDILSTFKKKDNETIDEHFDRRYKNYCARAGLFGREDLFMIADWVFLSTPEIVNEKFFPNATMRGYVEALFLGDSRTGKTMVAKHTLNRYKIGDFISGSSGVSRAGLIGCVNNKGSQRSSVSFGKFATNDRGVMVIDETQDIPEPVFRQLTAVRSEGKVQIVMSGSGSAPARVAKLWISNERAAPGQSALSSDVSMSSMEMLLNVCLVEQHLSRFDIATIVRSDDVDVSKFNTDNLNIDPNEFTDFKCQTLAKWCRSRKKEDIVWDDGLEEHIDKKCKTLYKFFHEKTQLINKEMRLKILRESVPVAGSLYSHLPSDRLKILVKKEHVDYAVKKTKDIYMSKNMRLDKWSEQLRRSETLGNMDFMENILKYIDPEPLVRESRFTLSSLQSVFFDYLLQVQSGSVFLPFINKNNKNTGIKTFESIHKVVSQLISVNAFRRDNRSAITKTPPFSSWLEKKIEEMRHGKIDGFSNILEVGKDELYSEVVKKHTKSW